MLSDIHPYNQWPWHTQARSEALSAARERSHALASAFADRDASVRKAAAAHGDIEALRLRLESENDVATSVRNDLDRVVQAAQVAPFNFCNRHPLPPLKMIPPRPMPCCAEKPHFTTSMISFLVLWLRLQISCALNYLWSRQVWYVQLPYLCSYKSLVLSV